MEVPEGYVCGLFCKNIRAHPFNTACNSVTDPVAVDGCSSGGEEMPGDDHRHRWSGGGLQGTGCVPRVTVQGSYALSHPGRPLLNGRSGRRSSDISVTDIGNRCHDKIRFSVWCAQKKGASRPVFTYRSHDMDIEGCEDLLRCLKECRGIMVSRRDDDIAATCR